MYQSIIILVVVAIIAQDVSSYMMHHPPHAYSRHGHGMYYPHHTQHVQHIPQHGHHHGHQHVVKLHEVTNPNGIHDEHIQPQLKLTSSDSFDSYYENPAAQVSKSRSESSVSKDSSISRENIRENIKRREDSSKSYSESAYENSESLSKHNSISVEDVKISKNNNRNTGKKSSKNQNKKEKVSIASDVSSYVSNSEGSF